MIDKFTIFFAIIGAIMLLGMGFAFFAGWFKRPPKKDPTEPKANIATKVETHASAD